MLSFNLRSGGSMTANPEAHFQTQNLTLRPYEIADVGTLFPILSDPTTLQFWPRPFTRNQVEAWVDRNRRSYEMDGFSRYIIRLNSDGTIVGDCGILRGIVAGRVVNDLGYIIHHPYWGRGYATEAARAIADYGLNTLKLDALHANMPWNHHASRRVAEKIGMHKIGEFNNPINRNIRTFLYSRVSEKPR
ncbi:GNAT family N-acetyltransferase [Lyngbya sp. CCY1209]|uniref:GNAT family N-acetyltransferase n=1 Tax=Lyngbya sp. CCY1209 TaxID=2886103 RepID=UPI002D1FC2EE|nr:GNAT family N-acetyltransferase [Lyngbya sp. CCY1209]MEB3882342.1 GNAT family N-acetyltransferase [Lyngbya sp. CCY1209]